jgi:hypothetical protein
LGHLNFQLRIGLLAKFAAAQYEPSRALKLASKKWSDSREGR